MSNHSRLLWILVALLCGMIVVDFLDRRVRDAFIAACELNQRFAHPQSYTLLRGLATGMVTLGVYQAFIYVWARVYKEKG